jgi:xanthine/uracil/vitamin C permease (AzgA family)
VGTLVTGGTAVALGLVGYHGLVAAPPSLGPTFARLDLPRALAPRLPPAVFVLFFLGLFDTVGTLVGVAGRRASSAVGACRARGRRWRPTPSAPSSARCSAPRR